jgi:hypothetical protein
VGVDLRKRSRHRIVVTADAEGRGGSRRVATRRRTRLQHRVTERFAVDSSRQ